MPQIAEEFLNFLAGRRSTRRYEPRTIEKNLLELIVEAALWAPSAHNRQPWRLIVITNPDEKLQLAQKMADRLRQERLADGDDRDEVEADVNRSIKRLQQAAALIVVFLTMEGMDEYPDERRTALEYTMAVQSTAMAGQNMLLMAHKLGLGACWICAPLFAGHETASVLGCPSEWKPQGLITLGWPESVPAVRERKSKHEMTRWI
jgi:F420 biosynthesis protein FbiB-like protein